MFGSVTRVSKRSLEHLRDVLLDYSFVKQDYYGRRSETLLEWFSSQSKGDQETFRRGALVRAETHKERGDRKVDPLSRRAHHVHPYFSDNLKYMK